jgi:hypothetical protein
MTSRKGKSEPVQTRIETGQWTVKSKQAKSTIGMAWAKFLYVEAIPGVKADILSWFLTRFKSRGADGHGEQ